MLTELPKPTKIVFCTTCRDVTEVYTDKFGDYCIDCQCPVSS